MVFTQILIMVIGVFLAFAIGNTCDKAMNETDKATKKLDNNIYQYIFNNYKSSAESSYVINQKLNKIIEILKENNNHEQKN